MSLGLCSMFAIRNVDLLTLNDLSKHSPLCGTEVQNIEGMIPTCQKLCTP